MYTMFKKAEFIFPEPDVLQMTVENTMVSREKAGELKRILEKILQERCGMGAVVEFTYVAPKESKLRKQAKEAEEAAAAAYGAYLHGGTGTDLDINIPWDEYGISGAKSGAAGGQSEENTGGKTGNSEVKTSNAGKKVLSLKARKGAAKGSENGSAGKSSFSGNGGQKGGFSKKSSFSKNGSFSRNTAFRKSDNPDVLYGRDFDDGFTNIEAIEGEVGEVTIRGQILTVEKRELVGAEQGHQAGKRYLHQLEDTILHAIWHGYTQDTLHQFPVPLADLSPSVAHVNTLVEAQHGNHRRREHPGDERGPGHASHARAEHEHANQVAHHVNRVGRD